MTTLAPPPLPAAGGPPRDGAGAEVAAVASIPTGLLIGGRRRPARSGATLAVEDPATGTVIARVADAGAEDCADALDAAAAARAEWSATPPRLRSRILRRAADLLRGERDRLALALTLEMGKPVAESAAEVEFAAEYLEWFSEEAVRVDGRVVTAPNGTAQHTVLRTPVGPCLAITPWNFPIAVPARAIGPALAAGCTMVLRPSALTPLSAHALADILVRAGLPAGVLNVVVSSTDGATDALIGDPRLGKLTFTGSAPVGRHLATLAAGRTLRTSLELGGCAPVIVMADADLDLAVAEATAAKMRNGGAACTAANRFYVERAVADDFTRRIAERVARFRIGAGTRPGVGCGPMISPRHVERLAGLVSDAVARGARVVLAGGPVPGEGNFFAPVVLADVPVDARVMREEVFGPVVAIATIDSEAEALRLANDCEVGLAAYLFTRDLGRAMRMAPAIQAGMVAVNRGRVSDVAAPFGGVRGSGFGSSGASEGIDEYLDTRYVTMPLLRAEAA